MKDRRVLVNPFRMISSKLDFEALRMEELHARTFHESMPLEDGLLVMMSKIIEMTRLLSKSIVSGSPKQMDACQSLGKEVHQEEKVLTGELVAAGIPPDLLRSVIRFPVRLERIGDLLESILNCSRIRARDGIPFSDKALGELDQLFAVLLDMMNNLRDAFITPNKVLLEHVISQGRKLAQKLLDFRLAHWDRLEAGFCAPQASSVYLDILDSFTAINEYIVKISVTLLELGAVKPGPAEASAPESGRS